MYRETTQCLICGNRRLAPILDLGVQAMTGVFPASADEPVPAGPLQLVKCHSEPGDANVCNLVQLAHQYSLGDMYGAHYGYRSGLNASMVRHLRGIVDRLLTQVDLQPGDLILDIGSNDGTLLSGYPAGDLQLLGIDPTGSKFRRFYPDHVGLIADFFSRRLVKERSPNRRARVITSIAMFYDLPEPAQFVEDIRDSLADDGLWVFEQSYLPLMLSRTAYDSVCHEHLEYYGLRQIDWLLQRAGLRILDVAFNDVNGGSCCVTACRQEASYAGRARQVEAVLAHELELGLDGLDSYRRFAHEVAEHRDALTQFVRHEKTAGRRMAGYGASTKGNVILQYCGLTGDDICCIAEVNEDKFGRVTPGTHIPIVAESDARAMQPDSFLVLPWHFRDGIVEREQSFLQSGGQLVFPLPSMEMVDLEAIRRASQVACRKAA